MAIIPVVVTVRNVSGLVSNVSTSITITTAPAFPDASTTGVRSGVVLTNSGSINANTAGMVISGKNITGVVTINAPNVRLVDCKVSGTIIVKSTGAIIEYVDVIGRNTLNCIEINPNGRLGEGDNTTVRFCDISEAENGIWLEGDGCVIEDSYIHNLLSNTGASDPHIDGIQIPAAFTGTTRTLNCVIQRNNLSLNNQTASACITMCDATNVDMLYNRLSGGAAVLRVEGNSIGCDVIGNTFGEFVFMRVDYQPTGANRGIISGNIDEATGNPVNF